MRRGVTVPPRMSLSETVRDLLLVVYEPPSRYEGVGEKSLVGETPRACSGAYIVHVRFSHPISMWIDPSDVRRMKIAEEANNSVNRRIARVVPQIKSVVDDASSVESRVHRRG